MYQGFPGRRGYESGGIGRPGDGKEACSPGLQVVEVQGRRSGHNAIEITRKHFGGFDPLTPAEGASKVIGSPVLFIVEEVSQCLAGNSNSVKSVRKEEG